MSTFQDHVRRAVQITGSQQKLADALGCTQQQISYLLTSAGRISAEMALKIDRATAGEVGFAELRPDLAAPVRPVEKASAA